MGLLVLWSLIVASPMQDLPRGQSVKLAEPQHTRAAPETSTAASTGAAPESDHSTNPIEDLLTPKVRLRGRIETDAIVAVQSPQSIETIGDLQNGYGFRRVRLGAQGTIGEVVKWVSEVELADANVRLRDVFIGLTMVPHVQELRVGYFREPFSLEGATSSNFLTFLERSPLNELDPTRNWGICGYWWPGSERGLFALGVFRDGTTSGGQSVGDQDAWAVTSRITGLPVYEPDDNAFRLVHLGMALSYRNPFNGVVELDPGPGSSLLTVSDNPSSPFLPPVSIPANSLQLYNLQAAQVCGSFSLQGEWFGTTIQQTDAGVVFLHGFYVDASYFLTGEHRGYDRTRAAFDRISVLRPVVRTLNQPGCGYGAVELATRFAFADFRSPNLPPGERGVSTQAVLYQLTVGANWYLTDHTRLMFNYTAGFPSQPNGVTTSAHLFSVRAALYW